MPIFCKTYQLIYTLMFFLLIKHSSNIIMYKDYIFNIHRIFDDIINENQHTITIFINTIYSRKCCIICKLYLMFFSRIILFYVECLKQWNLYSSSLYYYFHEPLLIPTECPRCCSSNGKCINGKCQCGIGYCNGTSDCGK